MTSLGVAPSSTRAAPCSDVKTRSEFVVHRRAGTCPTSRPPSAGRIVPIHSIQTSAILVQAADLKANRVLSGGKVRHDLRRPILVCRMDEIHVVPTDQLRAPMMPGVGVPLVTLPDQV